VSLWLLRHSTADTPQFAVVVVAAVAVVIAAMVAAAVATVVVVVYREMKPTPFEVVA